MDDILVFGFYLHRAAYLVDQLTRTTLYEKVEIPLPCFLILDLLDTLPQPVNQQMLVGKLLITKGAVSKQLRDIERRGLIEQHTAPHNKKDYVIVLQPAGKSKLEQARVALSGAGMPIATEFGLNLSDIIQSLRRICLLFDPDEKIY